jgi:hypothetical protein
MFKLNSEDLGNFNEIELTCRLLFENGGEVVLQGNVPPMTIPQIFLKHTGAYFDIKFETLSVDHPVGNQLFCLQLEANGLMIETYRSPPFSVIVKPDQIFIPRQILNNISSKRPRRTSEAPRSPREVLDDLTSSTTAIQAHVTELSTYFQSLPL